MDFNMYLLMALLISLSVTIFLLFRIKNVNRQLLLIKDALEDMKSGNLNRRILTKEKNIIQTICYDINDMAINDQSRLVSQKKAEQAYKRLMTNLSHDVKTPLASLIGYLEAIKYGIVTGEEKEDYMKVALNKAYSLKDFIVSLFEWVKLDAGEQVYNFENRDINELSRDFLTEWILTLESNHFEYEIDIPENECDIKIDVSAYNRILNNLFQNILRHSGGNKITVRLEECAEEVKIYVTDNGNGMSEKDVLHIFERTYTCDNSRATGGNGLGWSISRELVIAHGGTMSIESALGTGATFLITFPKPLQ